MSRGISTTAVVSNVSSLESVNGTFCYASLRNSAWWLCDECASDYFFVGLITVHQLCC